MPLLVALLLPSLTTLQEAPLVVRGEVVARGAEGGVAWTTVVIDRVLHGAPGAGAVTFSGAPDLTLGERVVLPLERRGTGFAVPAGAGAIAVRTTAEIEDLEDALLAAPRDPAPAARAVAATAALLAAAGLLLVGLRLRLRA